MRIEQLMYFVEAVNQKSINKAAEKLFLSQSTISDALKKLESELDISLLNKGYSGVTLSLAGQEFYIVATNILEQLKNFKQQIAIYREEKGQKMKEQITVGITPEMLHRIMPHVIKKIKLQYPDTHLLCRTSDFMEGLFNVIENKVDCALMAVYENILVDEDFKKIITENDLEVTVLIKSKVVVMVNPESKLANRKRLSVKEALKMPVSIYKSDLDPHWHEKCFSKYGKMKIAFISDSYELCNKYVELNKDTIGFTNQLLIESQFYSKNNINIPIPLKEELYYAFIFIERRERQMDNQILQNMVIKTIHEQ